jgi:protein phosphatase
MSQTLATMVIKAFGQTDTGMKRPHNEDCFYVLDEQRLYLVADGMGGHSSGEVASKMAVETIANFFRATGEDEELTWPFKMEKGLRYEENRLVTGIKLANLRIFEAQQRDPLYKGMGTTIASAFFANGGVYLGHVGDSRIYRIRGGEIELLTEDHSLLNDYIKMKKLTREEIENFPHKNVIVRALGMRETVQVDVTYEHPRDGDVYLLCSDGLSGMVSEAEMLRIVKESPDLETAGRRLVEAANQAGGVDNITVLLTRFSPS